MTLHRVDWNFKSSRDIEGIQVLLVSQQHYSPWHGCKPADERLNMLPQQRIVLAVGNCEPEALVQGKRFGTMLPPQPIDRAACCYLAQPEHQVLVRIDRADAVMELQKDLLRKILRERAVHQHAQRDAVNPGLVQPDERRKAGAFAGACGGK